MAKSKSFFIILILGSLAALGPFSIDMYLPGFKAIAKDLNTDVPNVQCDRDFCLLSIRFGLHDPVYAYPGIGKLGIL